MQLGLILLCLALPLLELAVLIKVGSWIGAFDTILLLIGIGIAGGLMLRAQGFAVLRRALEATRAGRPLIEPMVDSLFLMLAGVLFVIPGFITDAAGLLLLIPPLRHALARWLLARMLAGGTFTASTVHVETRGPSEAGNGRQRDAETQRPGPRPPGDHGVVIDGEWERVDDPAQKRPAGDPPRPP